MGGRPRVHFPRALYAAISRSNQRQKIFKTPPITGGSRPCVGQAIMRHSLTLIPYALIQNHSAVADMVARLEVV
jgi:hypothetical protein